MDKVDLAAQVVASQLKKKFADDGPKAAIDRYGTVSVTADGTYVLLDGADAPTPAVITVEAHHGDRVICHIVDHSLVAFANITVPSVNDEDYAHVKDIATEANELLDGVAAAASTADKTVAEILSDAHTASGLVSGMKAAADTAGTTLAQIVSDADSAASTLSSMQDAAEAANTTLTEIFQDAEDAKAGAAQANTAASNALTQLSFVEDVAGTIDWIQKHGTFTVTQDTTVQEGTAYFAYNSTTQDYEPIVSPTGNPSQQGWCVLDVTDSQTDFIMAHLAVTTRGLWVLPSGVASTDQQVDNDVDDATGSDTQAQKKANANARKGPDYKLLLSNDGTYIYDGYGAQVALYGPDGIVYADDRSWHLGSQDAYIVYTPASGNVPASITIGGSSIRLGDSRTLSELLEQVDTPTFHIEESYNAAGTVATVTAHVIVGGSDVTQTYPSSCFAWYRKSEDGAPLVPLSPATGYSVDVTRSDMGYGSTVVCKFTEPNDSELLTSDDDTLTTSDDTPIAARTPSGDYVRVADLEATTTVFDTDKLLLVGSEQEQLVTIATLKDVFGDGDYERLDNMPSIEDVTLVGNKTFPDLGIFRSDSQGYPVADDYTLTTLDINALWANAQPIGA